jgi:type IV pilus assembly protein PilA
MIVVAIVGILAAIALPAYQDYIIRSKMSEAEAAIAACKTSVAEYTATHGGTIPDTTAKAGCSTTTTQYVNGGVKVIAGGVIIATSQGTGATPAECQLTLTPAQAGTFELTKWTGTSSACSTKFVPSTFR